MTNLFGTKSPINPRKLRGRLGKCWMRTKRWRFLSGTSLKNIKRICGKGIVSVLFQHEGGIGKSIPNGRGKSLRGGMDFAITPEFWWSADIFCGQGRIDSVKINPSLLMMRECKSSKAVPECSCCLLRI